MKSFISLSVLLVASGLVVGCAGTGAIRSGAAPAARGSVVTRGQVRKAIVQGPTVIHAYTADAGGGLYTAPAVTGSDADCGVVMPATAPVSAAIRPEQRVVLNVEVGHVACVATSNARSFELLWHAHDEVAFDGHEVQIALATKPAR